MALTIALGDPVIIHVLVLSPGVLLIPTGVIIMRDGNHTVSVSRLDNTGNGIFNVSSTLLGVGVHEITVYYAGDQNFAPGLSGALEVDIVTLTPSVTTIIPSSNNITYGNTVSFMANVVSGLISDTDVPTGTVTFFDGANSLDTETLVSGSATSTSIALSGGSHAVIATYSGDTEFNSSSSLASIVNVNRYTPSVSILSNNNPSNYGSSVIFSSSLTVPAGTNATGTITYYDGITPIGSTTVSANSASLNVSTLIAGSHNITAQYSGDGNFNSASSSVLVQTVNGVATTTTLVSSANPITWGMSTTLTATVSSMAAIPVGTVTFYNGMTVLGTSTLNGLGIATLVISPAAGTESLMAIYNGNANYSPSTSNIISEVINKANTNTFLASSMVNAPAGVNVIFTATVTGSAGGAVTGNVQFKDGITNLGIPVTVNGSGVATYTTNTLAQGTHSITAVYNGDSNNNTSTSNVVNQSIAGQASTTTLMSSANPVNYGTSIVFTANVTGSFGTPTGTIQFMDGASPIGTLQTLISGSAMLTTSILLPGSHSITAVYSGDGTYAGSTSPVLLEVINKLTPTFTLVSTVNPAGFGSTVTFNATLGGTSGVPTGTVQFVVDGVNDGVPIALASGLCSFSTSTLSVGTHTVLGVYSGDGVYTSVNSNTINEVINLIGTTTSISSSVNPSTVHQNVVFSSTVSSVTTGTPTGTVTFSRDGGTVLGTVALSSGSASLTYNGLAPGSHTIVSSYSGDSNFHSSTSGVLSQTVNATASSITLASNTNPSSYGQNITLSVNVIGSSPTGTVTVKDNGSTIFTLSYPSQSSSTTPGFTAGSHPLVAYYGGDSNNAASISNTVTQVVNKESTHIAPFTVTPSGTNTVAGTYSLSATVASTLVGGPTPTGTMTFYLNTNNSVLISNLGTVNLSAGTATLSNIPAISTAGTYQFEVDYNGDANYNVSISLINNYVVTKLTPSILQTFNQSTTNGVPNTRDEVSVGGPGGAPVPTGTATIYIDGVNSGLSSSLTSIFGLGVTAAPNIFIPSTAWGSQGNHSVQASYSGDSYYNTGLSSVTSFFYLKEGLSSNDIAVSANPSTLVIGNPGFASSVISVTVTGNYGVATGTVSFIANGDASYPGPYNLGTATLSNGSCSITVYNTNPPWSYANTDPNGFIVFNVQANYSGDATYDPQSNFCQLTSSQP